MTTITQKTATDGQLKSLLRKGADATEKAIRQYFEAGITKEGAQRVDESPEFVARIHAATVLALVEISTPQEFKDEEVPSTYGYLSGYECLLDKVRNYFEQNPND